MVMDHTNCTHNEAIKVLRETNDDMVQAVMKLTDNWNMSSTLCKSIVISHLYNKF